MSKWEMVKLGEVCDVRDGTHDSPKYVPTGYPLVTSRNLTNGYIDISDVNYVSEEDYKKINFRSCVHDGDIIMPMIGTIGNPVIVNKTYDFAIKNVALIKFNNNKKAFNKYISYILSSDLFLQYIDQENRGGTQKFISLSNIRTFNFPLPPLDVQKQIADTLDKASRLIALRKTQLEKMDLLIKSKFIDMFGDPVTNPMGWEMVELQKKCTILRGGSPRPIEQFLGGTIPWIKIGDATSGSDLYLYNTSEHIIEAGIKKSRFVKENSLIFANCGVSLGFARIIKFDGCIHDGWLAFEKISEDLNKIFLLKTLNHCTEYFRRIAPDGTQPNLNTGIMKVFKQIIPPLLLQNQFAEFVEMVEQQKTVMQQGLDKLETNYKALMQEYFG